MPGARGFALCNTPESLCGTGGRQASGQAARARTSRKVLRPMARLSDAPMRVCTASNTCMRARSAGTKEPT